MTTTESNNSSTPAATNGRKQLKANVWHEEETAFRLFLDENMSGQDEVKDQLVEILAAIRNPLRDPNAPIFSVLMCGPSTSGKTLGFKLLTQWVHGDRSKLMFFSGSEYMEKHQLQKLIGAPHGYIGYVDVNDPKYKAPVVGQHDDSAMLAQHNINNAKIGCEDDVVFMLFDEWEKFHFAFNLFMLRPLREGTGELNNGQPVNFRNCVIGFTSNLGSEEIEKLKTPMGFSHKENVVITTKDVRQVVVRELTKGYPPEFRNRINKVLFFAGLDDKQLLAVVDMELKTFTNRILSVLGGKAFTLSLDDNAKAWLLKRDGTSDEKSPLPGMQQKLNEYLVLPLGRMVRSGMLHAGDRVEVEHREGDDELSFFVTADPLAHLVPAATTVEDAPVPSGVSGGNDAAKVTSTGSALAVIPGKVGTSDGDAPSATGIEVCYLQPFKLIIPSTPEQLEAVSARVREVANSMPHTVVVEYTNRMNGTGTAEVQSTLAEMVALQSQFTGLRVIVVGFELGVQ